jgi:hypothetical protein
MAPSAIVKQAVDKGIELIAICDHNTTENSPAVIKAAQGKELTVLPGLEVTTREEVHVVALFDNVADAYRMQTLVYANLEGENDERAFGMQPVVDANGWVLNFNPRLLIGATKLGVEATVNAIHEYHGLAIAAHIDREGFGIIGQLGFIPKTLKLDALEISYQVEIQEAGRRFSEYRQFPFLRSSDAHFLGDIGRASTILLLEKPSFDELGMALRQEGGRKIIN